MSNYIAINQFRSSTSSGFSNTWEFHFVSNKNKKRLLSEGMPVSDVCYSDRTPVYSTMGIRNLTSAERSQVRRMIDRGEHVSDIFWVEPDPDNHEYGGWVFS